MTPPDTLTLEIKGMTCTGCATHIQKALTSVPGVIAAQVPGWQSGKAIVRVQNDVPVDALLQAVAEAGYQATLPEAVAEPPAPFAETAAPAFQLTPSHDYDLIVIGTGGSATASGREA